MSNLSLPIGLTRLLVYPGLTTILSLGALAVIILLVAANTWLGIEREKEIFQEELEARARLLSQTLNDVLGDPLYFGDVAEAAEISSLIATNQPQVNYIRIFDTEGKILVDTQAGRYPTDITPDEHLLQEFSKGSFHQDEQELIFAAPVMIATQRLGTARVSFSTARL